MKWQLKDQPHHGATRIVRRFAFLPMRLNQTIIWWEWVRIKQKYDVTHFPEHYEPMQGKWLDVCFVKEHPEPPLGCTEDTYSA